MPMEYFEQRERALLGDRFDVLYAAPQETAERGVTVSALPQLTGAVCRKSRFPTGSIALLQGGIRGASAG